MTTLPRPALRHCALLLLLLCVLLAPSLALADAPAAKAPVAGQTRINPKDGAVMIFIPAGEFIMGSYPDDASASAAGLPQRYYRGRRYYMQDDPDLKKADPDEFPAHTVHLDGFWMYKTVVSVGQYREYCTATGHAMPEQPDYGWDDENPIVNVSWNDAVAYAKWAGARLPSEAEWELGARGFCGNRFPWGDDWEYGRCACSVDQQMNRPAPVKSFVRGRSQFGLYGMCGNVWQWCADRYSASFYDTSPRENPGGPDTGERRVTRGGSWRDDTANILRSANRNSGLPSDLDTNVGFRCAKSAD